MYDSVGFNQYNIKEIVIRATELYNKYRAPEAISKIIEINGDYIKILFEGHFCKTCAVNDWIEDFKYILEDMGVEAELTNIIEPYDVEENWRIGVFKLKKIGYEEQ